MKNALKTQVGMLGDMFLWLVANLKQGGIYFIKQALPPKQISRECIIVAFTVKTAASSSRVYNAASMVASLTCVFEKSA